MRYALLALAALAFVATADFTTCKAYGAKYDLSTDWTPGHCASEGYGLAYRELLSL